MTDWTLPGSIAILSAAGFVHGLFGIGFAMIATPLLALFLDYRAAVLLAALPLLVMAASWLVVHRDRLRGSGLPVSLLPAIAVGATVGTVLQASLPEQVSLVLLAGALTGSVVMSVLLERPRAARATLAGWAPPAFGTLAGVTESALNVGAPLMVLYGALARLDRVRALIALNVCFALGKTIQIGLMQASGLPRVSWLALGAGTAASLLAFHVGDAMASRFPEVRFRIAFRCFLVAISATLVLRALYL